MILFFIIPIVAALAFPLMALWLQRAMRSTRDPWGVLLLSNAAVAAVFIPPYLLLESPSSGPPLSSFWRPLLCAVLFFVGQVAGYKSFAVGDISLAVPLQGAKVFLVALLAWIFIGQPAGWNVWTAALLIPPAMWLLRDHPSGKREERKYLRTFALASLAAVTFAGLDVGIQAWSPEWGVWRFGFWTFLFQAVISLTLFWVPGRARRKPYSIRAWLEALGGSTGLALISLGLVWVIATSGRAAWVNILFNSRVLWSVVFVWAAGRRLAMREGGAWHAMEKRRILAHRFLGAALMTASIVLAVL